jgi:glycerophosphoryl diester phosphodiesterase
VEFDVRLSSDGAVVVMHDATVERTTNGTGDVARLTLKQLRRFDAGYHFGPQTYPYRERGITIPTAQEALDETRPLPVIVEVKTIEAAEPLLGLIRSRGDEGRVTVGSFVTGALTPFRRAGLQTTAASDEVRALLLPAMLGYERHKLPFTVLSIPPRFRGMPLPLGALARCVAPAGVKVHVWTVNSPPQALRLWRMGVAAVLSDDPQPILEARQTLG